VAFHGWEREEIGIGGATDPVFDTRQPRLALKNKIKDALLAIGIPAMQVKVDPPAMGGSSVENIVNRLTINNNGIQIEQSLTLRKTRGTEIARAIAGVYRALF
jgi:phage replication-related protein YjqB (UPF0714/DUF867 family)